MGFSRQEHWSGLPFPPPGGLPDPGIEPASPASPATGGWALYHLCHFTWGEKESNGLKLVIFFFLKKHSPSLLPPPPHTHTQIIFLHGLGTHSLSKTELSALWQKIFLLF